MTVYRNVYQHPGGYLIGVPFPSRAAAERASLVTRRHLNDHRLVYRLRITRRA